MRRSFLGFIGLALVASALTACGEFPNMRAQHQHDCRQRGGTYQDEGGSDAFPADPECLVPTANGQIVEIEYDEAD